MYKAFSSGEMETPFETKHVNGFLYDVHATQGVMKTGMGAHRDTPNMTFPFGKCAAIAESKDAGLDRKLRRWEW